MAGRGLQKPGGDMRIASNILGGLIVLVGTIWFLQGINVLPGSFMTGQIRWPIYGSIVVVAGGFLLLRTNRRREGPDLHSDIGDRGWALETNLATSMKSR